MANWKALTWSESLKTGKQTARHVLTVLCLKCDDDYRVFSDATRIAGICEISTRRLYDWRDYLEEHGLITVIRRLRPNGSEAKPITLLNAPDAPHLNGTPVVLDYNGKHLYPRHPHALHATGIEWISNSEVGRVHPSHTPIQGDSSSGCQHDSSSRCATCTEERSSQAIQGDSSSGCQHDDSSPHGGDNSSPPKHSPSENSPTNHAATDEATPDESTKSSNNWMAGEEDQEDKQGAAASEPGASFLRSLSLPDGTQLGTHVVTAEAAHATTLLNSGWGEQELAREVTDASGMGPVRSWAALVRSKLRNTQPKAADRRRFPSADEAHQQVTGLAKRGEPGAREAAYLLGIGAWPKPERGEQGAQEYLLTTVPTAATVFVEDHRDQLVAVITRSAATTEVA